jgi:hypothetical protein
LLAIASYLYSPLRVNLLAVASYDSSDLHKWWSLTQKPQSKCL